MLARTVTKLPVGEGLRYEPKWDGFRSLVTTGPVRIFSRSGRPVNRQWPELVSALDSLPAGLLLDGEIVCWLDGGLSFDALLRRHLAGRDRARALARAEPAHFVAFDLLRAGGRDIAWRSLAYRREQLEQVFAADHDPHLDLVWQTGDTGTAREWFEGLSGVGIEGVVIKDSRRAYSPGKRAWEKLKARTTTEAIVGGLVGSVHLPRALLLGRWKPDVGKLVMVGRTTDLDGHQQAEIVDLLHKAGSEHPWPPTYTPAWGADRAPYSRVRPELVVEVEPDVAVSHGRWRHPVKYIRPRPDLRPGDVPTGLELER
jgi:ATP-dependent DNA ligase